MNRDVLLRMSTHLSTKITLPTLHYTVPLCNDPTK